MCILINTENTVLTEAKILAENFKNYLNQTENSSVLEELFPEQHSHRAKAEIRVRNVIFDQKILGNHGRFQGLNVRFCVQFCQVDNPVIIRGRGRRQNVIVIGDAEIVRFEHEIRRIYGE